MKQQIIHEEILIRQDIQAHFSAYEENNAFVPSHWHSHLEILFIASGSMTVVIGNQQLTVRENGFIMINSGEIHSTLCNGVTHVVMLQIPSELLRMSIPDYDYIRFFNSPSVNAHEETAWLLRDLILHMNKLHAEQPMGWQLRFQSLLYEFLYLLYCSFHEKITSAVKVKTERNLMRLELIHSYVKEHYQEPISLEEAARVSGLNPEYFCRFFKKYMGVTFLHYVNTIRLTHICEDLLSTDYTVTELLTRHGFTNYRLFMRMFKQTYGCTPLQRRRQAQLS